jgi:hypothetical protein
MSSLHENLRTRVPSFSQMTALGVTARNSYIKKEECMHMPSSIEVEGGGVGATVQIAVGGRSVR